MKKVIVFLLLGISLSVSAQKYVPFPTENAAWNVFYAYSYNGEPMDTTMLQYSLQGDTTISGKLYRKVCRNIGSHLDPIYKWVGGLREQDKKVYYFGLSYYEKLGTTFNYEFLLYDFNKQIGDTVRLDYLQINSPLVNYIISEIDSIKIGEKFRKLYKVRPKGYGNPEYIVEGIGNITSGLFGVITPIPTCLECHQDWQFICFSQNGETVCLNPAFVDCNSLLMSSISESKASNQFVRIYPNPANEYIQFEFDIATKKNTTIEIIDHAGKRISTIPILIGLSSYNFDISHYPAGVYFVLVHYNDKTELHKIIKY